MIDMKENYIEPECLKILPVNGGLKNVVNGSAK